MSELDRRSFLGASAGAVAAWGWAGGDGQEAAEAAEAAAPVVEDTTAPPAPAMVTLGHTGIRTSRLAQGTGVRGSNRQSDQTRMGFESLVALFRHAYQRGIRFFDLADLYGTHIYFREALRGIPRDEVTILTKIWWPYDGPRDKTHEPHRAQHVVAALERFCHELTTDHLDIVLLHCLQDAGWTDTMGPYLAALDAAKQRGQVRAVGVSCHDMGALRSAAASPWVDVILARINAHGVKMDASPAEVIAVLRQAKANGKTVLGMKIFGEGQLAEQRDDCLKYAMSHDFMDAMTIGFHEPAQIDDVLRRMAQYA